MTGSMGLIAISLLVLASGSGALVKTVLDAE